MMRRVLSKFLSAAQTRRADPRSESGQAVVILAIGFIALVGFVGIVTDVSLMFVQYSTLSRAVDSAAIAAAGQMRSDRDFGEVGLAARQYVEFHGLNPEQVLVATCQTSPDDDELCTDDQRKLVRVSAEVMFEPVFMRLLGFNDFPLWAHAISETAVLDVIVIMDVSESMLHDTTYEDWAQIGAGKVYVPPTAQQILNNYAANTTGPRGDYFVTGWDYSPTSTDSDTARGFIVPDPPPPPGGTVNITRQPQVQLWNYWLNQPQQVISEYLEYDTGNNSGLARSAYPVMSFDYPGYGVQQHPRLNCRVRFWPYSNSIVIPDHIKDLPSFRSNWQGSLGDNATWQGFAPAFDFYGCCNDPSAGGSFDADGNFAGANFGNGDNNFSDLICQPFKQARDATRQFLERIDFSRGDRVAFVNFDRGAFIVDPDGANGATSTLCVEEQLNAGGRTELTHMIESRCRALDTLDRHIGVRAEPNFYVWNENGGGWTSFADGIDAATGTSRPINYYTTNPNAPDLAENNYPVRDNCPFQNAALPSIFSRYSLWDWNMGQLNNANPAYPYGPYQTLGTADPALDRIMTPNPRSAGWASTDINRLQSYELWASCRGTNMGAALREANNALLDPETTRRTNTVWVMVMLSDGAAGASDPVRLEGEKPIEARPYRDLTAGSPAPGLQDWASYNDIIRYGTAGEYGWFGLCPIGFPNERSQLTRTDRDDVVFPFCSDEQPHVRHFCRPAAQDGGSVGYSCNGGTASKNSADGYGFAPGSYDADYNCALTEGQNLSRGNIYDVDIGDFPNEANCDPFYDVDDYARDWADFVGLTRGTGGAEQLPTVFTIGFGLDFVEGSSGIPGEPGYVPGNAALNVPDFLGEELLRYIADVGDNNQLDTDYQQDYRDDTFLNRSLNARDFGVRGPCEEQELGPPYTGTTVEDLMGNGLSTRDGGAGVGSMVRPLPPRQNCGNYYNAPNQAELEIVFNDIASRMFTRLAQ